MRILFDEMFRFVKGLGDYAKSIKTLPLEGKEKYPFLKYFFPDAEIITLADTLMETIPVIRENIVYRSKTHQKLQLIHLAEKIRDLSRSLLPSTNFSVSIPQQEMKEMNIWNFTCINLHSYSSPPWSFSYFDLILDELSKVKFLREIQLQDCNLSADDNEIYLTLQWHGPFEKVELLTIPGVTEQFWSVTCDARDLLLPLNVMRYLLYLQVAITWDKNKLIPREIQQNGTLTATIQIQKANSQEPGIEEPLSETAWQNVSDYIVQQSYEIYVDISQKLEFKLNDELERRKKYVNQGILESKYVDQIQKWISNLAQFRQAYLEEISKEK